MTKRYQPKRVRNSKHINLIPLPLPRLLRRIAHYCWGLQVRFGGGGRLYTVNDVAGWTSDFQRVESISPIFETYNRLFKTLFINMWLCGQRGYSNAFIAAFDRTNYNCNYWKFALFEK